MSDEKKEQPQKKTAKMIPQGVPGVRGSRRRRVLLAEANPSEKADPKGVRAAKVAKFTKADKKAEEKALKGRQNTNEAPHDSKT